MMDKVSFILIRVFPENFVIKILEKVFKKEWSDAENVNSDHPESN